MNEAFHFLDMLYFVCAFLASTFQEWTGGSYSRVNREGHKIAMKYERLIMKIFSLHSF